MSHIDRTLAALADPARRQVIQLLRRGPRRASDIAIGLELSRPAMSRHLRVLRMSGLVEEEHPEEDARVRLYRLRPEAFSALRRWLDEVERFWGAELKAFQKYADETRGRGKRRS